MEFINLSQQEQLAVFKVRFDEAVKERDTYTRRIAALEAVAFVREDVFDRIRNVEIRFYHGLIERVDRRLAGLRKVLGIETPTSNEGAL